MTVLDRVPVEAITSRRPNVDFGRLLVAVIGGLFFVAGWAPAKAVRLAWFAISWCAAAVAQGAVDAWSDGKPAGDGQ